MNHHVQNGLPLNSTKTLRQTLLLVFACVSALGAVGRCELREMQTDRPDVTESPFTIDVGHLQIESSFFEYSTDRRTPEGNQTRTEEWSFAPTNFRIGLTPTSEIGIIIEPVLSRRSETAGSPGRQTGVGDITIRGKFNFWGNDGGPSAFGLMPFVKVPTHSHGFGNRRVEGGLIVPFAYTLSGELGSRRDDRDRCYTE